MKHTVCLECLDICTTPLTSSGSSVLICKTKIKYKKKLGFVLEIFEINYAIFVKILYCFLIVI